jgi:hypothetical protein
MPVTEAFNIIQHKLGPQAGLDAKSLRNLQNYVASGARAAQLAAGGKSTLFLSFFFLLIYFLLRFILLSYPPLSQRMEVCVHKINS